MKKLLFIPVAVFVVACNNSKKKPQPVVENNNTTTTTTTQDVNTTPVSTGGASVSFSVNGEEISNHASLLVSKDKDNLQPGLPYFAMLTSNGAQHNNEYLTLNFLLDTKPGTYPVVGSHLQIGNEPTVQMYGGIMGGDPKLTDYKVTITECKDLGNHSWSISGTCEEIKIKAMGVMLLDKTKNHPEEVTLQKISFSNLQFNDNLEELMKEGMKKLRKQ